MKTYGKKRCEYAKRKIKGTNLECPCCIPYSARRKSESRVYKKRERQEVKKQLQTLDIKESL